MGGKHNKHINKWKKIHGLNLYERRINGKVDFTTTNENVVNWLKGNPYSAESVRKEEYCWNQMIKRKEGKVEIFLTYNLEWLKKGLHAQKRKAAWESNPKK